MIPLVFKSNYNLGAESNGRFTATDVGATQHR